MTDNLYDLYKTDPDYKRYVDEICKSRMLGIYEAFRLKIVQSYAEWLVKSKEDKRH